MLQQGYSYIKREGAGKWVGRGHKESQRADTVGLVKEHNKDKQPCFNNTAWEEKG